MKKLVLVLIALNLSACGFNVVDTGTRGIKVRLGEVIGEPLSEGLYFYNPFTTSIHEYSVREEKWTQKTEIFTKDTQKVDVEFSVVYYPDPKYVNSIFKDIGPQQMLEEKIVKPVVLGSIKDAIGGVIDAELVMKREIVTKTSLKEVQANLLARHVIVTDLQFTNLDFDDAYEKAVEQKVVAIQDAQKAVNQTVEVKEKAKQIEMTATAEANAMKIKSAALSQNKGLVAFEWVQKWDGKQPQIVMGGSSIPMLDMGKLIKAD